MSVIVAVALFNNQWNISFSEESFTEVCRAFLAPLGNTRCRVETDAEAEGVFCSRNDDKSTNVSPTKVKMEGTEGFLFLQSHFFCPRKTNAKAEVGSFSQ